jgi:hypothetical protein
MFGCHSKKRPNNLIIGKNVGVHEALCDSSRRILFEGRMFDYNILDMFEFGVEKFVSMDNFPVS